MKQTDSRSRDTADTQTERERKCKNKKSRHRQQKKGETPSPLFIFEKSDRGEQHDTRKKKAAFIKETGNFHTIIETSFAHIPNGA